MFDIRPLEGEDRATCVVGDLRKRSDVDAAVKGAPPHARAAAAGGASLPPAGGPSARRSAGLVALPLSSAAAGSARAHGTAGGPACRARRASALVCSFVGPSSHALCPSTLPLAPPPPPGMDCVFHVATAAPTAHNAHNRELMRAVNVDGTANVVDACAAAGVPRLVYTSSASVVFDGRDLYAADEGTPYAARPMDYYTHTKIEGGFCDSLHPCCLLWGPGPGLEGRPAGRQRLQILGFKIHLLFRPSPLQGGRFTAAVPKQGLHGGTGWAAGACWPRRHAARLHLKACAAGWLPRACPPCHRPPPCRASRRRREGRAGGQRLRRAGHCGAASVRNLRRGRRSDGAHRGAQRAARQDEVRHRQRAERDGLDVRGQRGAGGTTREATWPMWSACRAPCRTRSPHVHRQCTHNGLPASALPVPARRRTSRRPRLSPSTPPLPGRRIS